MITLLLSDAIINAKIRYVSRHGYYLQPIWELVIALANGTIANPL